jgi:putative radical SAM enzyme (TIGR03279 family)
LKVVIKEVIQDSIADQVGIEAGDYLVSINGNTISDMLDYQFYSQDDELLLEIEKPGGDIWEVEIEKDCSDELGIIFDGVVYDRIKVCKNHCLFCFIDQMPPGMRKTLYVKDDDYRYSFLYGNYITLTNLKESDWEKIITMRLSPLYVSVHTTNGELRREMMNNPRAGNIKADLKRLTEAGIEIHTQIVLCPEINDGEELITTIEDLAGLYPAVQSIGIVPVGLTGYRDRLPELQRFNPEQSKNLVAFIEQKQKYYRHKFNHGLVYLADEFYIKAGLSVPPTDYYDDFVQIENGIGLVRNLWDEFEELLSELPAKIEEREVFMVTGRSAAPALQPIVERLNEIEGLFVTLLPVDNLYFGGGVSVTGLLTGHDILKALGRNYAGKRVIIPEIVFQQGNTTLLDDITLQDIKQKTEAYIYTVDGSAGALVEAILYGNNSLSE